MRTEVGQRARNKIHEQLEESGVVPDSVGASMRLQRIFGNELVSQALRGPEDEHGEELRQQQLLATAGIELPDAGVSGGAGGGGGEKRSGALGARAGALGADAFGLGSPAGGGLGGMVMPSRTSTSELADPERFSRLAKSSSGRALPKAIADRLGPAMGADVSGVQVHTDAAAVEMNRAGRSAGMAIGGHVFLGEGTNLDENETLIEEVFHTVQAAKGVLPNVNGLAISNPNDSAEVEARNAAKRIDSQIAGMRPITRAAASMSAPASGVIMRDTLPGAGNATAPTTEGPTAPSNVRLNLGGWSFEVAVPTGTTGGTSIIASPPASSIAGFTIQNLSVQLGETFDVRGGSVTASLVVGDYVNAQAITMRVDRGGNIDGRADNVDLRVGDLATGKLNLQVGADGISGTGVIQGNAVRLIHGLQVTGGQLDVSLATSGALNGNGVLNGNVPGVGTFQLTGALNDKILTGGITADLTAPIALGTGVRLKTGHLTGSYAPENSRLDGVVNLEVGSFASAELRGAYDLDAHVWDAQGIVTQTAAKTVGEVTISNAVLNVAVNRSVAGTIQGELDWAWSGGWQGHVAGTYKPDVDQLDATGTATLTTEKSVGALKVTSANGTIAIEANVVKTFSGTASALLPYQGEDTFRFDVPAVTTDLQEMKLDGTGTVTLIRDLEPAPGASTRLKLLAGGTVTGNVADNQLVDATGTLAYTVADSVGEFGRGSSTLTFTQASGSVDGQASFAFTANYGFPDRNSETSYFKPGGTVVATVAAGALQSATVDLPFAVKNPGGAGALDGTLRGTIQFDTGNVGGTGTATVSEVWPVEVPFGDFQFDPGGTLSATVADSALTKVTGRLPFQTIIDGDPALSFTGTADGDLDVAASSFTGGVEMTLDQPSEFALQNGDGIELQPGSRATSRITANQLQALQIVIEAVYKQAEMGAMATGQLTGELAMPTALFTGQGGLTLTKDVPLTGADTAGGKKPETWAAFFDAGSTLQTDIDAGVPKKAEVGLNGHMNSEGRKVAEGQLSGQYLIGDPAGLTGRASITVVDRIPWSEGGRFSTIVDNGTSFDAALAESKVTSANATLNLMVQEGGADKIKTNFTAAYAAGTPLSGSGALEVVGDVLLATRDVYTLNLATGSAGTATVAEDKLSKASGLLKLRLDKGGTPLLDGDLDAAWDASVENAPINANGAVRLLSDFELGSGKEFRWFALTGSKVTGAIADSQLQTLDGTIKTRVDDGGGPWATADLTGLYTHAGTTFTGAGEATVTRDKDVGATSASGHKFILEAGGSARADVQNLDLQTLTGTNIKLRVEDSAALIGITLGGTYTHAQKSFTGSGEANLLRRYELGALGDYTFFAEPGAGIKANVTANALSEITGNINATVETGGQRFLGLKGNGTYKLESPSSLDFDGQADILSDKKMASAGGFDVWMIAGTGAKAQIVQNQLQSVSGVITTRVDYQGEQFAKVDLNGDWTPGGGFNGRGTAELVMDEWKAAAMGKYSLWLTRGAGAEVAIAANQITEITGNIPIKIKEGEAKDFMVGKVGGNYRFAEKMASGSGTLQVVQEQKLLQVGSEQFWLLAGNAGVTVANNDITQIGGGVQVGMRDGQGQYLRIGFTGTFRTAEGRFDGTGQATVEREKKLPNENSPFAITTPTSAAATIENNMVTKVNGSIGFLVYNAGTPLLKGVVQGDWNASTNVINGSGDVRLASDQKYGPITFKAGSGGLAEVKDSKLQKFTGDILASLADAKGPLVDLRATGEFNAVTNTIVQAEGSATMLRTWEPIAGLVISDVSGSGKIAENKITEVQGNGTVAMAAIHAKGTIAAKWRNDGSGDKYSGEGSLAFDWAMGSASGRGITGAGVTAKLNEDQTFEAKGHVDYAINEKMKGNLGIAVTQDWDPVLDGQFSTSGTLVEGRELFKKEMSLIPHQFINVFPGVGIGFGMVGSMGMNLQPMNYTAAAAISNFHPLLGDVPDFEAALGLTWGMNFFGQLAPYIGVGVGIPYLNLMAGLEGAVRLDVPVQVGMEGKLFGRGGQYGGELGMGASVRPAVSLAVSPFINAQAGPLSTRWSMGPYPIASAELFSVEWNSKYTFGDAGSSTIQGAGVSAPPTMATAAPMSAPTTTGQAPPSMGGSSTAPAQGVEGGPQISGSDAQQTEGQGGGGMAGIMEKAQKIQVVAEGVGAMGRIIELLGTSWNLPVLAVKIAMDWDTIAADVRKIGDALGTAWEMLRPLLPGWFDSLKQVINDGLSALTGAFNLVCDAGRWVAGAASDFVSWINPFD